jgi:hypothetical protein
MTTPDELAIERILNAQHAFGTVGAAQAYVRLCKTYGIEE